MNQLEKCHQVRDRHQPSTDEGSFIVGFLIGYLTNIIGFIIAFFVKQRKLRNGTLIGAGVSLIGSIVFAIFMVILMMRVYGGLPA